MVPILKAKYGEFDERDWRKVQRADEEFALCTGCQGNCLKANSQWIQPVVRVEDGAVCVSAVSCKYARVNRIKSRGRLAKIPPIYIGKTFADYQQTADNSMGLDVAKWLVEDKPEKGAYFYGGSGTGKTFLASIVAQEYLGDGYRVIFGDVPSLLSDIKATFDTKESTAAFIEELVSADLLVLDDIGVENVTEWSTEQLYRLINGRYNEGKPTLVTSNYDFDGLAERYKTSVIANRLTGRLREKSAIAFFGNHDRRQ